MAEQWDRRFASIMRETELSLDKVKSQLHSSLAARCLQTQGSPRRRTYAPTAGRLRRTEGQVGGAARRGSPHKGLSNAVPVITRQPADPSLLRLSPLGKAEQLQKIVCTSYSRTEMVDIPSAHLAESGNRRDVTVDSTEHSPVSTLGEELATVQSLVGSLQSIVQEQSQQIHTLRGEVSHLRERVRESEANHSLDRQLEELKMEVSCEMDLLRRQHRSPSLWHPTCQDHGTLSNTSQEVNSCKRVWSGDVESLQRDMSLLKSRMVRQESKMAVLASSLGDVERMQEETERALSGVEERRCNQWPHGSRQLDGTHQFTTELATVRKSLLFLEQRLTSLEQRVLSELSIARGRVSDDRLTLSSLGRGLGGSEEEEEEEGRRDGYPLPGRMQPLRGEGALSLLEESNELDTLSDGGGTSDLSDSVLLEESSSTSLDTSQ